VSFLLVYMTTFLTKNLLCALAVHLHDTYCFGGSDNASNFKTCFKAQVFENDNIIKSVYTTKTQICENSDTKHMCIIRLSL